jgi:hypothetical protein
MRPVQILQKPDGSSHQFEPIAGMRSVKLQTGPIDPAQIQGDPDHLFYLEFGNFLVSGK